MGTSIFGLLSSRGFLGAGAPLFSDLVVVAMVVLVPWFSVAVRSASVGRRRRHAIMMGTGWGLLLAVVIVFVAWNLQRTTAAEFGPGFSMLLAGHLVVAVTTLAVAIPLAGVTLIGVGRWGGEEPRMGRVAARWHRRIGKVAVGLFFLTAGSGVVVYALNYLG